MSPKLRTYLAYAALPLAMLVFAGLGLWLVGRPEAPDFTLPVVAGHGAGAGDRMRLSDHRGKVVLLDFWASWCGPCRQSIPIFNRVGADYADDGVVVLGINVEAELSPAQVRAAHAELGATFPSVHDEGHQAERAYSVDSLPMLVVIDREGVIREARPGVPDEGRLRALIEDLVQEGVN